MMPQHRTPESLIPRSDSKNPASTCSGITSSGRPCRRALAIPKSSQLQSNQFLSHGVVAVLQSHPGGLDRAAFYCWQHKDQAVNILDQDSTRSSREVEVIPLEGRTSIDSLVARLGVASIAGSHVNSLHQDSLRRQAMHTYRGDDRSGPYAKTTAQPPKASNQPLPLYTGRPATGSKKKSSFWSSLCCMTDADDDDYLEVVRHKHRVDQLQQQLVDGCRHSEKEAYGHQQALAEGKHRTWQRPQQEPMPDLVSSIKPGVSRPINIATSQFSLTRRPLTELPSGHANIQRSGTHNLLSFIPKHLTPATTSALLNELAKPISSHDEAGYIYIFWLTDSATAPSKDTATSLLSPSTSTHSQRLNDTFSSYSSSQGHNEATRTIKLKIGRANNVHRRMNEWTRQCGYNLSLVRWYPHVSSSTHASPASSPSKPPPLYPDLSRPLAGHGGSDQVRKVPHAHRVERLIHLELADKRVKRNCGQCGREHREWFEVEASEAGIRSVDEVVKRWVAWAERSRDLA